MKPWEPFPRSVGRPQVLVVLFTVLATIGCDRLTKTLVGTTLKGEVPRSYLSDTVRLEYTENTGAFLGLGRNLSSGVRFWLFTAGTSVLLALVAGYVLTSRFRDRWDLLAWSLLLAGGLSNLVDRIVAHGRVVDFLNVGVGPLRTGVFNLADLAITVAALLLIARRTVVPPQD